MSNKHAFLIGVDQYRHKTFKDLPYVAHDVSRLSDVLENTCDFQIYDKLTGSHANKENLLIKLDDFFSQTYDPDTLLLLYFSGHGFLSQDYSKGYLSCYDTKIKGRIVFKALEMRQLREDYFESKHYARQLLIILDCCHSGVFLTKGKTGSANNRKFLDTAERAFDRATGLLAACREGEAEANNDESMSQYTEALIEILEGYDPDAYEDGALRAHNVGKHLDNKLSNLSRSENRPLAHGSNLHSIVFIQKHIKNQPLDSHKEIQPLKQKPIFKIFKPLSSVLCKDREFFPSTKLFEDDLVFFTESEIQKINEIQNFFQNQDSNIFLLTGNPASGKTVMALYVGRELEKNGFSVFYYKLTAKTNFYNVLSDFDNIADEKRFFIIDDCHLNLEVATQIYDHFDQMEKVNCLLSSRIVPKDMRRLSDFDYLDIFESLKKEDKLFELNATDVFTKMSGIIQKYKDFNEKKHEREFFVGDEQKVIQKAKKNYLMLYFYLSFWEPDQPLADLDKSRVLTKMYERYLGDEPYRDLILKYAALYQYEIEFEPAKHDEKKAEQLVRPKAILERNHETYYYSFYHSDFAILLLEAYANHGKFQRDYRGGLKEFTIEQFKSYFSDFSDNYKEYPDNLNEIFLNLARNNGQYVFKILLENDLIADFAYILIRFLSILNRITPGQTKVFFELLIFNNPKIKKTFVNSKNSIYAFLVAIKLCQSIDNTYPEYFLNLFEEKDQKQIILNSDFHIIGSALNRMSINSYINTAKKFFSLVTVEELIEKAKQANFQNIGNALNELKNIDPDRAQQILADIDLKLLVKKAGQASFNNICRALNELKNIDPGKAKQIFADIGTNLLVEKSKIPEFRKIANGLSNLFYVENEKTSEIYQKLDSELLLTKIVHEKYTSFLYDLPALAKINPKKTRNLLAKTPDNYLFQYGTLSHLPRFNKLVHALNLTELKEYADQIIAFANKKMERFMSFRNLKDIGDFLNFYSYYGNVNPIIDKYYKRFFGKVKFSEKSEIPYFIRVIYDHDTKLGFDLLSYVTRNFDDKTLFANCYYNIALSLAEQKNFQFANLYLNQAISIFEEVQDNESLAKSYFELAKNSLETENKKQAEKYAKNALKYTEHNEVLKNEIQTLFSKFIYA